MEEKRRRFAGTVKVGERGQIVIPKEIRDLFGIKAGDSVVVLHWVDGDMTKAPEVLSATASDGAIKFTTSSLSPFAIVKLASADGSAASPKTGEATMAVVALMLLSAAGIVVLNRKKLA